MMSIMLGDAPTTLLAFTILSSAHLGMHDFEVALLYAERAVQILQPRFNMSILNPTPKVRTAQLRLDYSCNYSLHYH